MNKSLEDTIRDAAQEAVSDAVATALRNALPIQEYYNTEQAAAYLGCSTQFLEIGRCRGGVTPPYIKLSRMVRYKKSDLDDWMVAHRRQHTAQEGDNARA